MINGSDSTKRRQGVGGVLGSAEKTGRGQEYGEKAREAKARGEEKGWPGRSGGA